MSAECPRADCDRAFVFLSTYVRHVGVVHGVPGSDAAWKLPKIVHDGVAQVPWSAKHRARGELVNASAPGDCGRCPRDGYSLPAHPNCTCSPEEGWDEFLTAAAKDRPENWTEDEWKQHIGELRKQKVKK